MSALGWLALAAYVGGYAWCFRFVVGYMLDDMGRDLGALGTALLCGAVFTLLWPALVFGRIAQRWFYARDERRLGFFRAPAPIESSRERARRLEREREDRERYIARLESDLGMPRTDVPPEGFRLGRS